MIKKITLALLVLCLSSNLALAASPNEYPGIELNYNQENQTLIINGSLQLLNEDKKIETLTLDNKLYHLNDVNGDLLTYISTDWTSFGEHLLQEDHRLIINKANGELVYLVQYSCSQNTCMLPLNGEPLGSASITLKPERE